MEERDTGEKGAFGMVGEEKALDELRVGDVSRTVLVLLRAVSRSRPFATLRLRGWGCWQRWRGGSWR